ncbi:efflux pump membrane transporter BepE [Variibacter gotjawalensis]|uniref:Efflux pump membrane transporter n=1 Tax=Variibacter gotjawalensis TaxID=1333996 RepID=A0A0S3PUU9_9BRAD|nr:multidrug efflux RND transporter permease subunit [Variibacter gotjawalensis]NIK49993.1 hydrophobe/amphiphile efflux-1 (HAE1) family protein [Variibacter gotjawalensis]RZS45992.1 hydrophobe/amphiphile efflux-1 (HAE1) family protein [Variibacter gotjawalensis]BAT59667.1 efflux pump membrane transporter BepE [Variibacter gotjawalensis]
MRFTHFFIERPIFAAVLSIVIVILGAVAGLRLPIAQYPEIAPPQITITGQYPGASAETLADTVVAPIEQQVNGVEKMLYLYSNSSADGRFTITVTFDIGTNLDIAQVQVQNRVSIVTPRLPDQVRQIGVLTAKSAAGFLLGVNVDSPDKTRDTLYLTNYVNVNMKDQLTRIPGVGNVLIFGQRDFAMQIWLDPTRLQSLNMTATDVTQALAGQNIQVSSGVLNAPPIQNQHAFQVAVRTLGRLSDVNEFQNVVVKQTPGAIVRLRDVARVELTGQDYSSDSYINGNPSVFIAITQLPGSNALSTGEAVRSAVREMATQFPSGVRARPLYDPTQYIQESVNAVVETIGEAVILVVLVVILFLQTWRAAIIPLLAIPISLVGTFFVMSLFGFSLNNLSLFGLILAIGIVVDDAIVVVENVERNIQDGMSPRDAAHKTMDEVGAALVSIALVLCAVFIPAAFITGISGQFYRQFALTIAGSTVISLIVSLTLSPAMCAVLLKPHKEGHSTKWYEKPIRGFFNLFNRGFDGVSRGYGWVAGKTVRFAFIVLLIYGGILAFGLNEFRRTPQGFIPQQDQTYLIAVAQLPSGASLARTDAVMRRASDIALTIPGIAHAVAITGFSGATFTNASNAGAMFVLLAPFEERIKDPKQSADAIRMQLFGKLQVIEEAFMIAVSPPPVQGIGNAGGFRMMIEDRVGAGPAALQGAVYAMMGRAAQTPGLMQVFSLYDTGTPQLYLDIDRAKAQLMGINLTEVFQTLQINIGSAYINDFNLIGRTFRVQAQADGPYRMTAKDVMNLRVRNAQGDTVPIGSFATASDISGPFRVPRYNIYPSAELDGSPAPGFSQGQAIQIMQKLAAETLPPGFAFEWTDLAYQQIRAGDTAMFAFILGVVFVFLVLAAQYESLTLPLAVIMIVPMCLVAAITGVIWRGMDNNILTQVGFIVLIALAAKNAILIVEFAKQLEDQGETRTHAATHAAEMRLRPIIMTSLAFILGVLPLVIAKGAGAELRQALGTAVFFGMIGVTIFGLLFTPAFYVISRWMAGLFSRGKKEPAPQPAE